MKTLSIEQFNRLKSGAPPKDMEVSVAIEALCNMIAPDNRVSYTLKIDLPLTTLNKYTGANRANKFSGGGIKKQQTNAVMFLAMEQRFKLPEGRFDVHFEWHKPNNMMDHDNIAFCKKFILDGIVASKAIKDDSPRFINNFRDTFILDKNKDYVWCIATFTITE